MAICWACEGVPPGPMGGPPIAARSLSRRAAFLSSQPEEGKAEMFSLRCFGV